MPSKRESISYIMKIDFLNRLPLKNSGPWIVLLGFRSSLPEGPVMHVLLFDASSRRHLSTGPWNSAVVHAKLLEACSKQRARMVDALAKRINVHGSLFCRLIGIQSTQSPCTPASIFSCCHLRIYPSASLRSGTHLEVHLSYQATHECRFRCWSLNGTWHTISSFNLIDRLYKDDLCDANC